MATIPDLTDDEDGELIELGQDEAPEVEDTEDGGALVDLGDDGPSSKGFLENLAEVLPQHDLATIARDYLDLIERDRQAREKRVEQYAEGLRRTGLGNDAPGGAGFNGASKVVHPMLVSATVDFASRAMKELFPPTGPATDSIPGDVTPEKVRKAKRKTALMNWQLTVQCPEARAEIEQLLTQVPMGGVQYLKLGWDEPRNRPTFLFVALDDMLLPYAATSFYSAQRRTHVQYLTRVDYEQRVASGEYRDVDIGMAGVIADETAAQKANDKIEGRQGTGYNEDGLREVYAVYALTSLNDPEIDGDDQIAPYIITIDKWSSKVLSIYRNWDEPDEAREEMHWFVEFPFVPWRGAYAIGLPQMIGSLSSAATGALRALLDSAHIQNTPSGIKLKGLTKGGQTTSPGPGEILEVEAGINTDDIRKLFMAMPYNPPSPVLFELLGFLVGAADGVVRTTFEDTADQRSDAPVGTTLARLEQAMVVFRAIHARLHDAMGRVLQIQHRLNGMYLNDEESREDTGEELATRADFEGPVDVVPVSDPNIFSETQRVMQSQAVAQRAALQPTLYNPRRVEEFVLGALKIPDADNLLAPAMEPKEQNAVNENVTATMGRPITAFPEQDHLAHLHTHVAYMTNPTFGSSQLIAPAFLPVMLGHLKEHLAWWYANAVFEQANQATGSDIGEEMKGIKRDPETRRALDRLLAEAGTAAIDAGAELFAQLPGVVQQAQQLLQSLSPQPQDPRIAIEGKKLELKGQELQQAANDSAADNQAELQREQLEQAGEDRRTAMQVQARTSDNTADNNTALQIAASEIAADEHIAVSTGTGINP